VLPKATSPTATIVAIGFVDTGVGAPDDVATGDAASECVGVCDGFSTELDDGDAEWVDDWHPAISAAAAKTASNDELPRRHTTTLLSRLLPRLLLRSRRAITGSIVRVRTRDLGSTRASAKLATTMRRMSGIEVITSRTVPLGGPRAMTVRRTLPQSARSLIGAWCFIDHYGPDDVSQTGGMDVPAHPHTGLQTVSWLFAETIEHRDSGGVHALVESGELNLMTAGSGVAHSEVSTANTTSLHGVQLWAALPDTARHTGRAFAHHVPEPISVNGGTVRVMLGTLAGQSSPVPTHSPLVGAEIVLEPSSFLDLEVDASFEHGVLVDSGVVGMDDVRLNPAELGYRPRGNRRLRLTNLATERARMLVLGGEPFTEPLLMW
jgi:redox-sensitive bicupin YhaK (pirin superfamily)